MTEVLVVGAGVAGTGAALAARRAGARVTLVDGGTGASTLATGALDFAPWTAAPSLLVKVDDWDDVAWAVRALGAYALAPGPAVMLAARVPTTAGVVRAARGHDAAVLDVAALRSGRVAVVRCARPGWDAGALAQAWGEAFAPIDAFALRLGDERALPDADFAARHDDDARLGWLGDRLREALARAGADFAGVVLPPSLGVDRPRAEALSALVGVPCGEATALPGGPSGLRFERARDRALAAAAVEVVRARVASVDAVEGGRWSATSDDAPPRIADAIVLATGGLLGGGIECPPADAPRSAPLRSAVSGPLAVGVDGRPLEAASSLFGAPPEPLVRRDAGDPIFARAGVLASADGAALGAPPGLFVAGETMADVERTWLASLLGGLRAGAAAARHSMARRGQ